MDYKQFLSLIQQGEKHNVDFKILCDAFSSKTKSANAELAKDICAMANNGNMVSYILIGVSDDGKSFLSVSNDKLTDDYLQNFCRNSISPPPKVKLIRKKWSDVPLVHNDKEFVIIKIGPQKRQAFHLGQNFLYYDEKVCLRKNEVWIRRGATSDIATPDGVSRLVRGESLIETPIDEERKQERRAFSFLSIIDKEIKITEVLKESMLINKYLEVQAEDNLDDFFSITRRATFNQARLFHQYFWKTTGNNLTSVIAFNCRDKILKTTVDVLNMLFIQNDYQGYSELHKISIYDGSKKYKSVRRICLIPVLPFISNAKIQNYWPTCVPSGIEGHYFFNSLRFKERWNRKIKNSLPSSSELLIISDLHSASDFIEKVDFSIKAVEQLKGTIVDLPIMSFKKLKAK